jgi:hypothetical protein
VGIHYGSLDARTLLTLSEACNAYLKVTGKQDAGVAKAADCSTSKHFQMQETT